MLRSYIDLNMTPNLQIKVGGKNGNVGGKKREEGGINK
ncbi:hypothetical protein JOC76_004220 [Neobacillus cucumis]|nr:hypothetical protein [Neobacillus cucumis]